MKKMILLACMALGWAACDKDDDCSRDSEPVDNVIRFSPSIASATMGTRTAYSGSTASWASGDAIGVYADRPTGNPPANVQYSYNGTAWTTSTNLYWTDGTTAHKFLGYAPYAAANTTYTAVKLPSLAGQTGAIDPTKDFLISNNAWTTGVTRPASAPYSVSLVFTHALTLIEFDISVTGFAANTTLTNFITAVSSGGALITSDATTSTINLATGTITAGTTANTVTATPGTPPTLSATPTKLYLLILPGTYTSPTLAVTLSEAGTAVSVPASAIGTTTFAPATKYTYAVNVTRTAITISNPSITDWISGTGGNINVPL